MAENYRHQSHNRYPENREPALDTTAIKFGTSLDAELFNSVAHETAKTIAKAEDKLNKPTQLRRFYDEIVLWETRASQQPSKFAEYLPFIRMMNAKAAYAEGRKLVNPDFTALIGHTLSQVNSPETLTHCKLFWEAFMGFYKQVRPKD